MCKSQAEGGRRCPSSSHYVSTPEKRSRNALQKRAKRVEARRAAVVARTGVTPTAAHTIVATFIDAHPRGDWKKDAGFKSAVNDVLALTQVTPPTSTKPVQLQDKASRDAALKAWDKTDRNHLLELAYARMRDYGLRDDDSRLSTSPKKRESLKNLAVEYAAALQHGDPERLNEWKFGGVTRAQQKEIVRRAHADLSIDPFYALMAIDGARDTNNERSSGRETLAQAVADPTSVSKTAVVNAAEDASRAYAYAAESRDVRRRLEQARAVHDTQRKDVDALTARGVHPDAAKALAHEAFISGEPIKPASLARDWKSVAEFPAELKASMFGIDKNAITA